MRERRRLLLLVLVVCIGLVALGCRRELKPGVYSLVEVASVTKDAGGGESDRSRLPTRGAVTYVFDADGTYVVTMSDFSFLGERPCSGRYEGKWETYKEKLRMTVERARLPRRCRPEAERIYLYQAGSGTLTLERHVDENSWMHYFLELSP